jgi:hypothetical protein
MILLLETAGCLISNAHQKNCTYPILGRSYPIFGRLSETQRAAASVAAIRLSSLVLAAGH